ncbi:hypothetical protein [Enterobacter mori]|uniref:hypothetical protein n=1 Tax=Enterobacter mori TaxID=539813 RepID=UPI0021C9AC6A|nr:hypothetical protein [Enterobacter mori]MCU3985015.1 hypothetical protein [Enterobacter mori]
MKKVILVAALFISFGTSAHTNILSCAVSSKNDIPELGNGIMTLGMAQGYGDQVLGNLHWTQDPNKPDANPNGWDTAHKARLISIDETDEDKSAAYEEKIGNWLVNYSITRFKIIMADGRNAALECTPLITLNKDGSVWQ